MNTFKPSNLLSRNFQREAIAKLVNQQDIHFTPPFLLILNFPQRGMKSPKIFNILRLNPYDAQSSHSPQTQA
ncbi:hypothetical protein [Nostoc sp. FACHB-280]|uniref:hypothetical protein n=1 Tax=Nostoc sp. FACHB-280 TaxID=2692839 RepID=UPI00168C0A43|nr:hypothetical protein [Nostoc sp. FACHB-280]MBD2496683.1 hypothetical protein [Nostoc sp. FACHB-280]